MATKNGVPFRQVMLPASKYGIKAPYSMTAKKVTLHSTDNQVPAIDEINYMNSNNNQVSYHVAIDEKEAIQAIPYNRNAYHAGDGRNGYGNRNTIAVEICRNYDRTRKTTNLIEPLKSQYSKAEQNTIKFVAQLCIDEGIVANNANIKTHNDWNGKWCPSKILNEKRLQAVKNEIIKEYNRLKKPAKTGWKKNSVGWWYVNHDGTYPTDKWQKVNDTWYLFDKRGYMLTGWQKVKETWYYLASSGAMQTGWLKLKDDWYYLNPNGAMATGWKRLGDEWYYLYSNGQMATGLIEVAGKNYYLQRNGVLITDSVVKLEANKHGHLK